MKQAGSSLSKSHLEMLKNDGFTVLHNFVPAALLQKLRLLIDEKMNSSDLSDKAFSTANGQNFVCNIEFLFKHENLACLELLGWPCLLEVVETICGPDFFLIQEFAVIKMLGDKTEVLWHQDMLHQQTGNCFTLGIYLDDANAEDGCLRVVPASHNSDKDICILKNEPYKNVPVEAGDILIHDMKLAHSSGIMQHNPLRRVIYFEFLSFKQAVGENIYEAEQLYNRMRLTQLAVAYYHKQNPGEKKFEWKNTLAIPAESDDAVHAIIADIHSSKSLGKPSAYCFENHLTAGDTTNKSY